MSDLKPMQLGRVKPLLTSESVDPTVSSEDYDWDGGGTAGEASVNDQWKQPCRVATTANITIATALNAGDTLDGVTLASGDRVLVKDQSTGSQNGIYIAGTTPERAPDFDEDDEVLGAVVYVTDGTAGAATAWSVTNTAATVVDTDAITWAAFGGGTSITALDDIPDVNAPTPSNGDVLTWDSTPGEWVALPPPGAGSGDSAGAFAGGFHGGGAAITAGSIYYGVIPFTGTITDWDILGDGTAHNATFDVAVCAAGALPVFPGDSIVAAAPPTMTADTEVSGSTLTGWSTAVTATDRYAIKFASGTATLALLVVNYSRP